MKQKTVACLILVLLSLSVILSPAVACAPAVAPAPGATQSSPDAAYPWRKK